MRSLLIALFLFPVVCCTAAGPRLNYVVAIAKFRQWYNEGRADSIYQMMSAKMQGALSPDKTQQLITGLHAQLGELKQTAVAEESEDYIIYTGQFDKAAMLITFSLNDKNQLAGLYFKPVAATPVTATDQPGEKYTITVAPGKTIYGTLTVPPIATPVPVVLLIAGSGATDRNCNAVLGMHTDAYKMLADSLLKAGIACLRYDKRGVGESSAVMGKEEDLRFEDMVADAVSYIQQLKADKRFSKIILLGHSEGSLVGMLAAVKEPVSGFISLAGAGNTADVILERQLKERSPVLFAKALPVLQSLKQGKTTDVTDPELQVLLRSGVQPYLISWFHYDPRAVIRRLNIPVSILQGSTDVQVSAADAQLLLKAQPKADFHIIANMTHVLKQAGEDPEGNAATYTDPSLPLHPELTGYIVRFIKR